MKTRSYSNLLHIYRISFNIIYIDIYIILDMFLPIINKLPIFYMFL